MKEPLTHGVQSVAARPEDDPAGQSAHTVALDEELNVPAAHGDGEDRPETETKYPGEAGVQVEAPAGENEPEGQGVHMVPLAVEKVPAGQEEHLDWPGRDAAVPAAQDKQPVDEVDDEYVPEGH